MGMPNDDDRLYFMNGPFRLVADEESERVTTELVATDDPNRFIYRITRPGPPCLIKSINLHTEEN